MNNKSLTIVLLVLILPIFGMFVVYTLLYQDIRSKNEHANTLLNDLASESNRQSYLISTEKVISNIQPDIDRINHSVISKDGDVAFIENLEALAHSNNLVIDIESLDIDKDSLSGENTVNTLHVKAKTGGSWLGTYKFLAELEALSYKIKVTQYDLFNASSEAGQASGKTAASNWQSEFNIDVLEYK